MISWVGGISEAVFSQPYPTISGEKRSHETTEESEEEEAAKRHKVDDDEEAEVEVSTEGGGGDDKSRVSQWQTAKASQNDQNVRMVTMTISSLCPDLGPAKSSSKELYFFSLVFVGLQISRTTRKLPNFRISSFTGPDITVHM